MRAFIHWAGQWRAYCREFLAKYQNVLQYDQTWKSRAYNAAQKAVWILFFKEIKTYNCESWNLWNFQNILDYIVGTSQSGSCYEFSKDYDK